MVKPPDAEDVTGVWIYGASGVQIVANAENENEAAQQFDAPAHRRSSVEGEKAVVTPLTVGEEKLWKEFGGCYRRANNKRE
jgi:hypothetical protein